MKVLLLTPPYHTGIIEITGKWPPLSCLYLAGALREAGHEVEVYDMMGRDYSLDDLKEYLPVSRPDAVFIGAFTPSVLAAIETLKTVKDWKRRTITVLGGVHATFCYSEILQEHGAFIDYIVRGEGEVTAVKLLEKLNNDGLEVDYLEADSLAEIQGIAYLKDGEIIVTTDRPFIEDLDSLNPAWDLLDWTNYYFRITDDRLAVVNSSRGCPHSCSFCSQHKFWKGTYRERSPESLIDELEMLKTTYGITMCMFADEYTTYNRERWETILDLIIERGLEMHFTMETRAQDIVRDKDILHKYRAAGFIHIYVGIESTKQKDLDIFNKESSVEVGREAITLLNNAGIITECSFILGMPDETAESIDETLRLSMEIDPDLAHYLLVTPWPYADLYSTLKPHIEVEDYSKYHFVHPIVKPINMERHELWDKLINCFATFYMNKTRQYLSAENSFKKRYMMKSIQIMHQDFFKGNFGKSKIQMPARVSELLERELAGSEDYINLRDLKDGGDTMRDEKYSREFVEELDKEITEFIGKGLDNNDDVAFNNLALKEFRYQYEVNQVYRDYCDAQKVNLDKIDHWSKIPTIPTQAFKQAVIASFPLAETELSLLTSGTTDPHARGKIYRDKSSLEMILKAYTFLTKEFLFPDIERIRIMLMVPSPKVAPGMPMAYGLEQAKKEFGTDKSAYYISPNGFETEALIRDLREAEENNEPVCLMGATSGYVFFFNQCRERGLKFNLPKGSRVCDGGGYQGTFGDCTREEYYELVEEFFNVSDKMCVNILGMGESGTNYFDNTLRAHLNGVEAVERHKVNVPWTRTVVVGVRTGQLLPMGEIGLIKHYDLTNRATVFGVQTDNLGYLTEDGFEIVGRVNASVLGHQNKTVTGIKDWLLGAGVKDHVAPTQGHSNKPAGHPAHIPMGHPGQVPMRHPAHIPMGHPGNIPMGHPPHIPMGTGSTPIGVCPVTGKGGNHGQNCSTVADNMLKAHGQPCSTVADAMIQKGLGQNCSTVADNMLKAHGQPCSTVADAMIQKGLGQNCSTVADNLMKAHGQPCSTVADGMIQKGLGQNCSTVADNMMKAHGQPCSTVVDQMIKK